MVSKEILLSLYFEGVGVTSKLFFIYGTRPEAIKIAPVVEELRALLVEPVLICTGQHTSLLEGTPAETVLKDSRSLGMPSEGSIFGWVHHVSTVLATEHIHWGNHVVVQGDTMSAFAGAAAASGGATLHHIEAGVRSFASEPWPEEDIRSAISGMADFHYCATAKNAMNLQKEGITEGVHITGNPVVTSLLDLGITPCEASEPPTTLLTLHRRELRERKDFPEILDSLFREIRSSNINFLWPVHPAMSSIVFRASKPDNLELIPPLSYVDFVVRLSTALGLITDSGGAVEEATTLGVPTIIFRTHNDRPEAVESRNAVHWDPTSKKRRLTFFHKWKRTPRNIYGDRKSAFRIASHIKKALLP